MLLLWGCSPTPGGGGSGSSGTSGTGGETTAGNITATGGGTGGTDGPVIPKGPPCGSAADCPAYLPFCQDDICIACLGDADCGQNLCINGQCLPCNAGVKVCSANQVVQCDSPDEGFKVLESCPAAGVCNAGTCFNCYPSTKKCEGSVAYECQPSGAEWAATQDCGQAGLQCHLGVCLSPCGSDVKANTNAGCGFFAVDLDNAVDSNGFETLDAWSAQFAVIASNTSLSETADVTVTLPDGQVQHASVPPRSLETFLLPPSYGQQNTQRSFSSFHIESNQPITVYQFNPLSNAGVFSNDASVLLPAAGLGNEYYAISHRQIQDVFRGFVTVVGISEATTEVTITPTTATMAGDDIPPLAAYQPHTFNLEQGEVVNIESNQASGDLTGTHVKANGPIAVFSGHEAAVTSDACCADHLEQQMVPTKAWGREYVMTRSVARGAEKDYIRVIAAEAETTITVNPAVMSPPVQVLQAGGFIEFATDSSFTVSATKPIMIAQLLASSYEVVPGAGSSGFCFSDAECPDQYVCAGSCKPPPCGQNSDCPQGHVCTAEGTQGQAAVCQPIGDPALILGVPVEQWRESYVFLTPNSYAQDYVNIVAAKDATVKLDGEVIGASAWEAISGSNFVVHRTLVKDGVHSATADKPVSVIVYGYDKDVSYGYPGGLGLQAL